MAVLKLCHLSFCQQRLLNQSELVLIENMSLIIYEPVLGGFQQKSHEVVSIGLIRSVELFSFINAYLQAVLCYFKIKLLMNAVALSRTSSLRS